MIKIDIHKKLRGGQFVIPLSVNAEVSKGAFITISGPSGIGKTTLLRILTGITSPDSGTISVDDIIWNDSSQNIDLKPQERGIGLVFQDLALFPNMTVEQNINFAKQPKISGNDADALITLMELDNLRATKPTMLSRGQQQRVAIARAMAQRPEILLLDEPFSALDQELTIRLLDYIVKLHAQYKITIILVTHRPESTIAITDQYWRFLPNGSLSITSNRMSEEVFRIKEVQKVDGEWVIKLFDNPSLDQPRPGDHIKIL